MILRLLQVFLLVLPCTGTFTPQVVFARRIHVLPRWCDRLLLLLAHDAKLVWTLSLLHTMLACLTLSRIGSAPAKGSLRVLYVPNVIAQPYQLLQRTNALMLIQLAGQHYECPVTHPFETCPITLALQHSSRARRTHCLLAASRATWDLFTSCSDLKKIS